MTQEKHNNKKKEELSIDDQIDEIKKKANARIKRLQEKKIKENMLHYKDRLDSISLLTKYDLSTCSNNEFDTAVNFLESCVNRCKKLDQKAQASKQKSQQKTQQK